jgi:hypothetical protein
MMRIALSLASLMIKDTIIDLECLRGHVHNNNVKLYDGAIRRYFGQLLMQLDTGLLPEAEELINDALKADSDNNMRWNVAMDYRIYAALLRRKGDLSGARQSLAKSVEIFRECDADGWVKRTEEKLGRL